MNKDIQTLIEREAEEIASKSLYPDKITNITVYSKACVNNYFQAGANFALSLFKWRKVSEGLPNVDEAVLCKMKSPSVIVEGFIYNDNGVPKISTQADFEFEDYANGEVIEWMLIPQID